MSRHSIRRGRSSLLSAVAVLALAASAGCSSGSDSNSSDAGVVTEAPANTAPDIGANDTAAGVTSDMGSDTASDTDSGNVAGSEECGGLSAADVGAAVGSGDFTSADDIASDGEVNCLFGNPTAVYGVTVQSESSSTYLAGDLDGVSGEDALSALEKSLTFAFGDDATVARLTVEGNDAVLVTGTAMTGGATGTIGAVVDGNVVIVSADGADLASDASGFEPIVTNVLALYLTTT